MFWYLQKDSSEISLGSGDKHKDKFSVSLTTTNRVEEWSESILTIKSLQVDDWRMSYTCIASNDEGSREKMVHVKGFGKNYVNLAIGTKDGKRGLFWNTPIQHESQNRLDRVSIYKYCSRMLPKSPYIFRRLHVVLRINLL